VGHKVRVYKDLYPQVYDWDNLLLAYRRASKGKRGNPAVAAFEYHLEDNLIHLREELVTKTYQPGSYYSSYIHEPKRRLISAAPFKDRVVHHALCNIMEPIFERGFISDSYANRVGKGTHRALDRAQQFARRHPFVLQSAQNKFCYSTTAPIGVAKLVSRHWLGWQSSFCIRRRTSSATPL